MSCEDVVKPGSLTQPGIPGTQMRIPGFGYVVVQMFVPAGFSPLSGSAGGAVLGS
jgi:hypothetical protein